MAQHLTIPARFNGPPDSGNGGYCCGALAAHIEGPARIRLHSPPPLETPMEVAAGDDGVVHMYSGGTEVGSAWPATLEMDIPPAPSLDAARMAQRDYYGFKAHTLPTCFVCGPSRPAHDGLEIFPGPVADSGLVACTWTPAPDMLDDVGNVRTEILWSALDCPGYFAALGSSTPIPALLGELTGDIGTSVAGGQELVVYAWPIESSGRKHVSGCAIATASGEILATSRAIWIVLKDTQ